MLKENIKETRLPNGSVVLTDKMPDVRSAMIGLFFRCGSRHEPAELNGITHFIEHCVFKGTQKRTALDIAIETDRLGGNMDAFTTHEETGFAIKVIDDRVEDAFDLLADMLVQPTFSAGDLKSERQVIIEEIKMTEDSPEERLGDIFTETFFAGHPLGLSIAGTPKTVRSFDRSKTAAYHAEMFQPRNLVIAAAGNIDHERLLKLVENTFGGSNTKTKPLPKTRKPTPQASVTIKKDASLEQAHFIVALPFVGGADPLRYQADLLTNIIGGGTSSRLWQKIREERGLAYSVGASSVMYRDCGFFSMFAATSPKHFNEAVDISIAELRRVAADGVSQAEVELVKEQTRASILLGLEDSAGRAASLAHSEMLHGRQIAIEETLAGVEAVTAADLKKLARRYFKTGKITLTALGDLKGIKVSTDRLAI